MKKRFAELVLTINKHSMALAFRNGTSHKTRSRIIEHHSADQPLSAEEALDSLKRVICGLAVSTQGLVMEVTALSQAAKINSGKFPDVNAIAQQVLDESIHSHPTGGGTGEDGETDSVDQSSLS